MFVKPGQALEEAVAALLELQVGDDVNSRVERNVSIEGPEGTRQIDVLLRTRVGPFDLVTIVECKDHGRIVSVTAVDALDSVAKDVKASKAVLVSRKGFSKKARQKAARLGITLMRADNLSSIAEVALDVPIRVTEYSAEAITTFFEFEIYAGPEVGILTEDLLQQLADSDLPELLREQVNELAASGEATAGQFSINAADLKRSIVVRNERGDEEPLRSLSLEFELAERQFAGVLSDLDQIMYLHDVAAGSTSVAIPAEELAFNYEKGLSEFTKGPFPGTEPRLELWVTKLPDLSGASQFTGMFEGRVLDSPPGDASEFSVPVAYRRERSERDGPSNSSA